MNSVHWFLIETLQGLIRRWQIDLAAAEEGGSHYTTCGQDASAAVCFETAGYLRSGITRCEAFIATLEAPEAKVGGNASSGPPGHPGANGASPVG